MAHHGRRGRYDTDAPHALEMLELQDIQARNRGHADLRLLLLEIKRLHDLLVRINDTRESIDRCWRAEGLGTLIALQQLRSLVTPEPAVWQSNRRRREAKPAGPPRPRHEV